MAPSSPLPVLGLATAGTILSGLIGGFFAAWVGGVRPYPDVAGVICLLALDGVYVVVNAIGGHPVWYSLGGAFTLMAATGLGGWIGAQRRRRVVSWHSLTFRWRRNTCNSALSRSVWP